MQINILDNKVIFLYIAWVSFIAGSSNGRTWAFEAQYLGSSPSPAANSRDAQVTSPSYNYFNFLSMAFKFESKDYSVEEALFGVHQLRVPQFQRPYTWEEDQCNDFWNDLIAGDSIFLGQFIFNYENYSKEKFVDIVDGQQRTTTILVLSAVFRDVAKSLGFDDVADVIQHNVMVARMNFEGPKYKVTVSPTLKHFFEKHIQDSNNIITDKTSYNKDTEEERVVKNYLYLKDSLLDFLKDMQHSVQIEEIKRLFELLKSTQVIITKIHDENDAYQIFESVNATGIDLNVSDLLKTFLFKKIKNEDGATKEVSEKWSEILENVSNTELTKFIRYYWLSRQEDFVTESKLFKAITSTPAISSWKHFLSQLLENAKMYYDLRNPVDADFSAIDGGDKIKNALIGIKEMNITQCYVLLLCLYRNRERIETNWIRVFELVEKFNFIYHTVSKLPANKVEKLYQASAWRIEKLIQTETDQRALRVGIETEFNLITNKLKSFLPEKQVFINGFIELSYKKKGICRYVLCKIEESLGTKEYVLNQPNITIEHILPQKPGKDWSLTQSQIKGYVHNIGNLTLLGKKPNGTVQNKSIKEKIKILKEATEIKITQDLLSQIERKAVWNESLIKSRAEDLAKIAFDKIWKIS